MCEDNCNLPPAPSTGDLVAVITVGPEKDQRHSLPPSKWRLRLSNSKAIPQGGETEVLFDVRPDWWRGPLNMTIQYVVGQILPHQLNIS